MGKRQKEQTDGNYPCRSVEKNELKTGKPGKTEKKILKDALLVFLSEKLKKMILLRGSFNYSELLFKTISLQIIQSIFRFF